MLCECGIWPPLGDVPLFQSITEVDEILRSVLASKKLNFDLSGRRGPTNTMSYPGSQQKKYELPPQSRPYPIHPGYPQMPPQHSAVPPPGSVAPPPYTPYPTQQPSYPPQVQQQMAYYPVQPMQSSAYDPGARFDGHTRPNIPPPPPGVAPNAAQMAAAHGQPVVMQQRNSNWLSDSSGGGYTFW